MAIKRRLEGETPERRLVVPESLHEVRLDKALRDLLPEFSRVYLRDLVADGFVTIGKRVQRKPSFLCQTGDEITIRLAPRIVNDAPPPPEYQLLHVDDSIIVINKPPGLAAHRNEGIWRGSVADYARRDFGLLPSLQGENRPGIVHRLDKDTSGVMVLARSPEAFFSLREQFADRTIAKEYHALIYGNLRFESEWIEQPIGRNPVRPTKMSVIDGGREASTLVEVIEQFQDFSYIRCRPKTGRTHQIRVHLSWLGHPIIGDAVYRIRRHHNSLPETAPPVARQLLHAFSLELKHPATGERTKFEAPLPEDFQGLLTFLRLNCKSKPG